MASIETQGNWLDTRGEHREFLFGENPELHIGEDVAAPLAALAINTCLTAPNKTEGITKVDIADSVFSILDYQDKLARAVNPAEPALYSFTSDAGYERIAALTTEVIWTWERAWTRYYNGKDTGQTSPFAELPVGYITPKDFERREVQLVAETASAVAEIVQLGYSKGDSTNTTDDYTLPLARFIATHGPTYATNWLNGDLIREYCNEHGYNADEWLSIISTKTRASIALHYSRDHISKAERVVNNLTHVLSTDEIAITTGLSQEEVEHLLPRHVRFLIAKNSPANPMKAVRKITIQLQGPLSSERIAKRHGWSIEKVDAVFPVSQRVQIALAYKKPHEAIAGLVKRFDAPSRQPHAIAKMLGWSEEEVNRIFTPTLRRHLAFHKGNFTAESRRIAHNYTNVLLPENIATALPELGLSAKQIPSYMPHTVRKKLAQHSNPLVKFKEVVATTNTLITNFNFSQALAVQIAHARTPGYAQNIAKLIHHEQANRPIGISEALWSWTIACQPNGSRAEWTQDVAAYNVYLRLINTRSVERILRNEETGVIIHPQDQSADPAEMLLPSDALESLQALAEQAGVTPDQLQMLLTHFSDNADSINENTAIFPILQRLRMSATDTTV